MRRSGVAFHLPLLTGLLTLAAYAWLALHNGEAGYLADDALYLLMADIHSPWRDATGALYEHVIAYSHLPPLYPLLLGLFGAGADHLRVAQMANVAFMAGAWSLYYLWLRSMTVSRGHAGLLALFCAWTPVTVLYTVDLWSEGLYVALVLLALLVGQRLHRRSSIVAFVGLGTLLACVVLTRSIGIALLPAVLLGIHRVRPLAVVPTLAGAALTLVLFRLIDMGASAPGYADIMLGQYARDPLAALASQLSTWVAALPDAALYDLFQLRKAAPWQLAIIAPLGLAAVIGAGIELRRRTPLAIYTLGYLAIAALWPFPDLTDRFLYPLMPGVVYFAWRGAVSVDPSRRTGLVTALLLIGLAAPAWWASAERALTPLPLPALDTFRTTRYWLDTTRGGDPLQSIQRLAAHRRAASGIATHVPAGECVYAMDVHLVLLYGRRPAFLPPPVPRMQRGAPFACRYFLLTANAMRNLPAMYPLAYLRASAKALALTRVTDSADPAGNDVVALLMKVN